MSHAMNNTTKSRKRPRNRVGSRELVSPSFHLYYRLPWAGAAVGRRDNPKYTVLRSDTEKVVAYCDTNAEAETMCRANDKLTHSRD